MKCCQGPFGLTDCHCGLCHQTFAGLAYFDMHQDVKYGRRPPVICIPPELLGLVQTWKGVWATPEERTRRENDRLRLLALRASQHGDQTS